MFASTPMAPYGRASFLLSRSALRNFGNLMVVHHLKAMALISKDIAFINNNPALSYQ